MPTQVTSLNPTMLINELVTWPNDAPEGTERIIDVGSPRTARRSINPLLLVIVRNPSLVSAVDAVIRVKYDDGGTDRYAWWDEFSEGPEELDGEARQYDCGLLGEGVRLTFANRVVLGPGDGFSARVVVYLG